MDVGGHHGRHRSRAGFDRGGPWFCHRQRRGTAPRRLPSSSSRVAEGSIQLEPAQDLDDFKRAVQTVKGIGAWSAEYMALRALGDTDAFPATDLVLQRFVEAKPDFDPDAARPWRGYLAMYLWNEYRHDSHQERKTRHAGLQTHGLPNWQISWWQTDGGSSRCSGRTTGRFVSSLTRCMKISLIPSSLRRNVN